MRLGFSDLGGCILPTIDTIASIMLVGSRHGTIVGMLFFSSRHGTIISVLVGSISHGIIVGVLVGITITLVDSSRNWIIDGTSDDTLIGINSNGILHGSIDGTSDGALIGINSVEGIAGGSIDGTSNGALIGANGTSDGMTLGV